MHAAEDDVWGGVHNLAFHHHYCSVDAKGHKLIRIMERNVNSCYSTVGQQHICGLRNVLIFAACIMWQGNAAAAAAWREGRRRQVDISRSSSVLLLRGGRRQKRS
jgi:hypothetical protein